MKLPAIADSTRAMILFHGMAAIVLTWPLAASMTTQLPLGSNDIWQNLWNFWWWRAAIGDLGTTPYATDLLFHPHGVSLALHTHSTFNQLVALPINLIWGPLAALNFSTLLGFALAGIAAHQLAKEVSGDRFAAYVAGLIFAFFPHHFEQSLEHLNLASVQFLPWIALYGMRVVRGGTRRDTWMFALVFVLNALSCWHYALFTLFILPWLWSVEWARDVSPVARIKAALPQIALAALVVVLVLSPLALSMDSGIADIDRYAKAPVDRGTDLAFLFVPSDHHPFLGALTRGFYRQHRTYSALGSQAYLGFAALTLAMLAWLRARAHRDVLGWSLVLVSSLALAVGAHPTLAGEPLGIPGPHAWFEHLPVLKSLRVANRFIVISMLALCVLAAIGLAKGFRDGSRWRGVLALLVVFEFLWLPYPMQHVTFSPLLDQLATGAEGAVLDIPFSQDSTSALNLAYQTRHGRPIAGGYVSVGPHGDAALDREAVLASLAGMAPPSSSRVDVDALRRLGFRYVVMHKDRTRQALDRALRELPADADFYRRRRFDRMPAMPDETFARIAHSFEASVGPPVAEDASVRIYALDREADRDLPTGATR